MLAVAKYESQTQRVKTDLWLHFPPLDSGFHVKLATKQRSHLAALSVTAVLVYLRRSPSIRIMIHSHKNHRTASSTLEFLANKS